MRIRLDKYLADMGCGTRSQVKREIAGGSVMVNGAPARRPEDKIDTEKDSVVFRGSPLGYTEYEYFMLNKPAGVVSATEDRTERTVLDLIDARQRKDLFPVGRLDKDSRGLLLMTNNGDIINKMMRAANYHEKEYKVTVDKEITPEFISRMASGVPILDTVTRPCRVEKIGKYTFSIILTQGLNRQIRRMCEALGYQVRDLVRVRVMNIRLGSLKEGQYRKVTDEELEELYEMLEDSSNETAGGRNGR